MEVKNYNQPVDASLFPEGCPRCSLLKFLLHLVPVAAVGLWGAYAAFRVLAHGLGSTALVLKLLYWKNRVNSAVVGAVISSSTALAIVMFFVTTL